jgi:hypothetical protein
MSITVSIVNHISNLTSVLTKQDGGAETACIWVGYGSPAWWFLFIRSLNVHSRVFLELCHIIASHSFPVIFTFFVELHSVEFRCCKNHKMNHKMNHRKPQAELTAHQCHTAADCTPMPHSS